MKDKKTKTYIITLVYPGGAMYVASVNSETMMGALAKMADNKEVTYYEQFAEVRIAEVREIIK